MNESVTARKELYETVVLLVLCRDPIPSEFSWTILFTTWNVHCDPPRPWFLCIKSGIVLRQILRNFHNNLRVY